MAKKEKKKKLDSIPKINRRLFKLWSEAVRSRASYKCEVCSAERGAIGENGKPAKIDAHHLMSRKVTNSPLKFELKNGVSVCASCHKFSPHSSFHMNPIVTMDWLIKNRPERFDFVLKNYLVRVNLHSREILTEIEESLKKGESLDIQKLLEIDKRLKDAEATT